MTHENWTQRWTVKAGWVKRESTVIKLTKQKYGQKTLHMFKTIALLRTL